MLASGGCIVLRELTVDQNVHCRSENNGNFDKGYDIANAMNFRAGKVLVEEVSYKSRSFFEMIL